MKNICILFIVTLSLLIPQTVSAQMHTFNGTDLIERIDVQVVYYLSKESDPLPDWQERIQYHIDRAKKFHLREFCGQSQIRIHLHPTPFESKKTYEELPKNDPNNFFWDLIMEVSQAGIVSYREGDFPVLLVMSDINFSSSYDDWTRICDGEGCLFDAPHQDCNGYVREDGDHRPGTRCGGSRAVYWIHRNQGYGLVTADGWRVPMKGTDCVFYHEGIGHTIGLPHPEPNDDSVMSLAQYVDSIQSAWINEDQKRALGWKETPIQKNDLFSTFSIRHDPLAPEPDSPIHFYATVPKRFEVERIELEFQTGLLEPFKPIPHYERQVDDQNQIYLWTHPGIVPEKSLAYRVRVELKKGIQEEIWHYIKAKKNPKKNNKK